MRSTTHAESLGHLLYCAAVALGSTFPTTFSPERRDPQQLPPATQIQGPGAYAAIPDIIAPTTPRGNRRTDESLKLGSAVRSSSTEARQDVGKHLRRCSAIQISNWSSFLGCSALRDQQHLPLLPASQYRARIRQNAHRAADRVRWTADSPSGNRDGTLRCVSSRGHRRYRNGRHRSHISRRSHDAQLIPVQS